MNWIPGKENTVLMTEQEALEMARMGGYNSYFLPYEEFFKFGEVSPNMEANWFKIQRALKVVREERAAYERSLEYKVATAKSAIKHFFASRFL